MNTIEKIMEVRANKGDFTTINENDNLYETFKDFIKSNSKLLSNSIIVEGDIMKNYTFHIEDDSTFIQLLNVDDNQISQTINVDGRLSIMPKVLATQIQIPYNVERLNLLKTEKELLERLLWKPFLKKIEKNIIAGDFFDKSLFNTSYEITGTPDFNGLLSLARNIKNKTDNGCIVGNSAVISSIIDTISKDAYLNEILLNNTIEGVEIISTKESPALENGRILTAFDKNKICLLLAEKFDTKKMSITGSASDIYQFICFTNGGDMFDSAIALKV